MGARRTGAINDPIGNYNFTVEIEGLIVGHFCGADGLSVEQDMIEHRNGDDPTMHKRPGLTKYGDITLKRGYFANSELQDFFESTTMGFGSKQYSRVNMSIVVNDNAGDEVIRWNLYECCPKSWKMASFDGKGNEVLYEEIVLVTEWFEKG